MNNTAFAVADWLTKLGHHETIPIDLAIRHRGHEEHFVASRYTFVGHYTADMLACSLNKVPPGTEYESPRIYVLGPLPWTATWKTRDGEHKIIYRIEDADDSDWYISGYMMPPIRDEVKQFHPFGLSWQLSCWDHEKLGHRIDHYDAVRRELAILVIRPASLC